MIEFALKILHAGLKTRRLDVHDAATLGLLDPLLPILVRCLQSRHAPCVVLGLKCLCQLASAPLPGLKQVSEGMGLAVMQLVDASPTTADPTCQGAFKLMARKSITVEYQLFKKRGVTLLLGIALQQDGVLCFCFCISAV